MRKVIVLNRMSLDGFFAGPNGELDWFTHSAEVDEAAHQALEPDTLLLGRTTYQMLESYWPLAAKDPNAPEGIRTMGKELNDINKVLFSTTLTGVTWENTQLLSGAVAENVRKLKQAPGQDIMIFGSGTIVHALAAEGLIDEYILTVAPVLLGNGKRQFAATSKTELKLFNTRRFESGDVLLHYHRC